MRACVCTNRLHSARTNVEKNGLLPKIDLRLVRSDGRVLIDALKVFRATPHFLFNVNSSLLSVYRALLGSLECIWGFFHFIWGSFKCICIIGTLRYP